LLSDIVDQLHDDDGFADAGAAEQADLAATKVGLQQIDHLDARLEHLETRGLFFKRRRLAVNRVILLGGNRTHLVHRFADHVEYAAESFGTYGNLHRMPKTDRVHSAHQPFGGLQCDRPYTAFTNMLLGFTNDVDGIGHSEAFAGDSYGGMD